MLVCNKCGNQMTKDEKFCGKCGGTPVSQETPPTIQKVSASENAKGLCCPDEQVIATLGNGYGTNLLYGDPKKCRAILTDKRVYLNGALYTGDGDLLTKNHIQQIVDVEDITGTGFIYSRLSKWMIFFAILAIPTIIGAIILFAKAFLDRKTFFFIQYAGGSIKFDAQIVGLADVVDFHNQIRRVKDKSKNR